MAQIACVNCNKKIDSRSMSGKCRNCYMAARIFSEEQRNKMSKAKKKNPTNYWLGKKRPEIKNWLSPFQKGNKAWNKGKNISGMSGKKHSEGTIEKMKNAKNKGWIKRGTLPCNKGWRLGKSVSIIHRRIKSDYGNADICEKCGSDKYVEWSNKDHKYKFDIVFWQKLCRKCHWKYDHQMGLR